MPEGKPAGVRCRHLTEDYLCAIYGLPERPDVCVRLRAEPEMCGECRTDALGYLARLEQLTTPDTTRRALSPQADSRRRFA